MYCSKCGKEINDNSQYCKYCGNALNTTSSNSSKGKENQTATVLAVIFAIISICVSVYVIHGLLDKNNKEYENTMKQLDTFQISVSFNCPYCKSYVKADQRTFSEMSEYYSCICPNCRKVLRIDKKTNSVTLLNKEHY